MHIFKNANFDFLRYRWHAIALSWIIIIAGAVTLWTLGDSARHRVRRRHGGHCGVFGQRQRPAGASLPG